MDWKTYLTRPNKIQFINAGFNNAFDTEACVTFATLKAIQTLMNTKLFVKNNFEWLRDNGYFNKDTNLDFSVRYTASMSNTTIYGNTFWNVMNCIKAYGLIPESLYPNKANSWNEYMSKDAITQEMKDLGAEFLKRFDIEDMAMDIAISPAVGNVRFADGDGILSPVGATNHYVMIEGEGVDYLAVSDSYWQEEKKYALDKVFYKRSFKITEKSMTDEQFIKNNEGKIVFEGVGKGRFGIIIGGKMREISPERSGQACLYYLKNATIDSVLFDSIPRGDNF